MKQLERTFFILVHGLFLAMAWTALGWKGPVFYAAGIIVACVQLYLQTERVIKEFRRGKQ